MSIGRLKTSIDGVAEQPLVIAPQKRVRARAADDVSAPVMRRDESRVVFLDGDPSALETYIVDFDINAYGREIYTQSRDSWQPVVRLSVSAIAATAAVAGQKVINKILACRMARTVGQGVATTITSTVAARAAGEAAAMRAKPGRFAWLSGKARSLAANARRIAGKMSVKNAALFTVNAGSSLFSYSMLAKDLSQWTGDALADFMKSRSETWIPDQTFTREGDFARLQAILAAGAQARSGMRQGASFSVSGRDIKALAILCSTTVMVEPLDAVTAASVADALKSILKQVTEKEGGARVSDAQHRANITEALDRTRAVIYIADPDRTDPSKDDLIRLQTEVRSLLLKFTRSIQDIQDWDAEDIFVPLVIIVERLVRLPGILTKILANLTAFGECMFASTFEDDTAAMLTAIDKRTVQADDGWWAFVKNFILYHLGFDVPTTESSANPVVQSIGGI